MFTGVPTFTTSHPDPVGVDQVQSHLRYVADDGVPVALILAGVTVEASIVQVAPLPETVISHLSQSVTPPVAAAIVTTPSAPVPVVVSVILLHSTSFILPPLVESVAV